MYDKRTKESYSMQTLLHFLSFYGLPAMFFIILLEYACFPVSSEIVLPLCGALAAASGTSYPALILLSTLAGILGTCICYAVGRYGGTAVLNRITRRFPKTEKSLHASRDKFEHYGIYAVAIGRVIPLCRTYIAFIAGASGMKFVPYLVSSLIGITVWNSILTGIGYVMQENWTYATALYEKYKDILIPLLLIAVLVIVYRSVTNQKTGPH